MNPEIRQLGPDDLAPIRALNEMFAKAFGEEETYSHRPPDEAYLQDLLSRPHVVVLVAIAANTVVGGLVAYELEKFEQARSEFYIYDLAVDKAWRRKGVATALIDALRGVARERGAWVIFVQGDYGDDPALALYGKLGTREEVLHFDIVP